MSKKVLIVEDFDDLRELLKLLVESCGYEVIEATNGIDAVMSVKAETPNLILMDIGLPSLDGITTTRIIREYLNGLDVPIIAVTAFDKEYQEEAIEAGCNSVLRKPVELDSMERLINKFLAY